MVESEVDRIRASSCSTNGVGCISVVDVVDKVGSTFAVLKVDAAPFAYRTGSVESAESGRSDSHEAVVVAVFPVNVAVVSPLGAALVNRSSVERLTGLLAFAHQAPHLE